ncbi:SGNH/GDSL hydrolase family protein, partial [Nostoc sp. NIES-2111]
MNKHFIAAGVVICSLMSPLKASAVTFTGIYGFGDSLTDTGGDSPTGRGNVFNATGGLIPPAPFYSQGRFTNGRIWLDQLASNLNLQSPTAITQLTSATIPQNGINFAFGGATTTGENTISLTFPLPEQLPGIPQQIAAYTQLLANTQQSADPNALYVLWAGANDYNPTQGTFEPLTSPEQTLQFISNSINVLASVGAKNFLVPNLPN